MGAMGPLSQLSRGHSMHFIAVVFGLQRVLKGGGGWKVRARAKKARGLGPPFSRALGRLFTRALGPPLSCALGPPFSWRIGYHPTCAPSTCLE